MKPPLAVLGRRSGVVLLRHAGPSASPLPGFDGGALAFSTVHDADAYLSFWLVDHAAMSRLRRVLHDAGHSRDVARCTNREVVRALAAGVASGRLEVVEREQEHETLDVRAAFAKAAAAAAMPTVRSPDATVVFPVAPKIPEPPLLPLLEEVQIEGAEVLPEVLQTLEQIDISLETLDLAALSLEPAPSAVPAIGEAMSAASKSITDTMDDL